MQIDLKYALIRIIRINRRIFDHPIFYWINPQPFPQAFLYLSVIASSPFHSHHYIVDVVLYLINCFSLIILNRLYLCSGLVEVLIVGELISCGFIGACCAVHCYFVDVDHLAISTMFAEHVRIIFISIGLEEPMSQTITPEIGIHLWICVDTEAHDLLIPFYGTLIRLRLLALIEPCGRLGKHLSSLRFAGAVATLEPETPALGNNGFLGARETTASKPCRGQVFSL